MHSRSEATGRARVTRALTAGLIFVAGLALPARASSGSRPDRVDSGWSIIAPSAAGMSAAKLDRAWLYAFAPGRNTQGLVVVRSGHIVAEWYAPGHGPNSWAASWSMAKSITSILIGIAIDEGKISSVDAPMTTWFPEWKGTPKAAITLRDVLTMTSGLASNETLELSQQATSTIIGMGRARNQLAYAAGRRLTGVPGSTFAYASPDAMLLSRVIADATGMPADEFAKKKLFDPLGIRQVEWWRDAAGNTLTYCCVDSTTRDFARIGQLVLDSGRWHGHQIVSSAWLRQSLVGSPASSGYGFQWWIIHVSGIRGPVYVMMGLDQQLVYVIPSEDLVVARSGSYVKSSCPPVADPNLFGRYPPAGTVSDAGTKPPVSWDHGRFLTLIARAVEGPAPKRSTPLPESEAVGRSPGGQHMAPCPDPAALHAALAESPRATAVDGSPTFTG